MFSKLLIANRGEIALRIMRTCRRLGLQCVAVYSEADRQAPHVLAADQAACVGPADLAASYLSTERLIEAARGAGAEALHPGYGFLSERPELAEACAAAGITFIGPSALAMRALGDKIAARRLARECGVPVVPGYDGDDQQDATLVEQARRLGFPVMVKAAAGGGGRGLRRVERTEDLPAALAAARLEAARAFGDSRLLLERLIEPARHVEVQLLADGHGRALAVGDRECSLQRRHQKVLEEAPAPALDDGLRAALHRAAERLALAAGYGGAGTVEFLVRGSEYYFLEVNARLQVEHTVTEEVTGLDLVEWQLRLAAGEPLALSPEQLAPLGHAVQARIYAEDPARGFIPSPGVVRQVRWPLGAGVRVDAGVTGPGQPVPAEYDPLLGKVICWGETRAAALARLAAALEQMVVLGVAHNAGFLRRLCLAPELRRGPVDTGFLARHPELAHPSAPPPEVLAEAAAAILSGPPPWRALAGWRVGGERRPITFVWEGQRLAAVPSAAAAAAAVLPLRGAQGQAGVELAWGGERWELWLDVPVAPPFDPAPEADAAGSAAASAAQPSARDHWFIEAPLAGRLVQLLVAPGMVLDEAAPVAAIEAMKMQHVLRATRPARVVRLLAAQGAFVRRGQPVVECAPAAQRVD